MQEDIFPAAEKILSDIENVVKKNPSLKSFEIIPAEDNENKSPVFHHEDCLGLASWCVQPLYCYAYRRLLELRRNKNRREEPSTVSRWLLGALLLNPDVTTFWNMRRELVRCRKLDPCDELLFSRLVLYHKPKCFEAFAYRRWLLPYVLDAKVKGQDPSPEESPLCAEIELASTCADRHANNYHAWSHRRHVMTLRESREYSHPSFEVEWKNSMTWCQRHVSDYSGLAYRQFLLRKCILDPRSSSSNQSEQITNQSQSKEIELRKDSLLTYIDLGVKEREETEELKKLLRQRGSVAFRESLDLIHGKRSSESTREHEEGIDNNCLRVLSYWADECRVNEESIRTYNDHEVLWYHHRFLAHFLMRLVDSYRRFSCYNVDLVDSSSEIRPYDDHEDEKRVVDVANRSSLIVHAFRNRTKEIIELAEKRGQYEKTFAKRFVRFLVGIGFEI